MSHINIRNITTLIYTGALSLLASCSDNIEGVDIHRLDRQISYGIMPEDSLSIKATETLFELSGYPYASPLAVSDYADKGSIREHLKSVENEFTDVNRESKSIGKVFSQMAKLLPDATIPDVFTIISPFTQSIFVADSTLYIGLNHYLGADYAHYEYFPDYVRKLKTRSRIPVDVAEAIIRTSYPFKSTTGYPKALERLIYEGAVTEAVMQVTGRGEQEVLGYDDDEYDWLCENEDNLWKTIVGKDMLFTTDRQVIRSLVDIAPAVSVISPDVPGRAGRLIGHRIVKAYLKNNPSVELYHTLTPSFFESESILPSAKYNP